MKRLYKGYPKSIRIVVRRLQSANFQTIYFGEDARDSSRFTIVGIFMNRIFDPKDFFVGLELERISYTHLDVASPTKDFLEDFDISVTRTAEGFARKSHLSFSRNFERNPLASPLLQISFAIKEIAKFLNTNEPLIIVTDSKLLREIVCHAFEASLTCRFIIATQEITKFLKRLSRIFLSTSWFLFNKLLTVGIVFKRKNLVLINTYLSDEQRVSSRFRDRYFPDLYESLIETHADTCYLLSGFRWYPRIFINRATDLQTFLPEFKYYSFRDFLKAMRMTFDFGQISENSFLINGMDLTYLWMRLAEIQVANWESCHFALRTRLMTNLERRDVNVRMLITEYEGMITEKVLALSLKDKVHSFYVAIQHNHMTIQLRSFFPLATDKALGQMPKLIVFMGSGYLSEFKLRYPDFAIYKSYSGMRNFDTSLLPSRDRNKWKKDLIIVGSVRKIENLELIERASRAFANDGYRLFLMLHPALPRDDRTKIIEEVSKRKIELYGDGFERALSEFDTFIGSSSGGLLRAWFSGKKVIRIASHFCLDIDPFTAISELLDIKIGGVRRQQNHEVEWLQYCLTNSDLNLLANAFQECKNSNQELADILKSLLEGI